MADFTSGLQWAETAVTSISDGIFVLLLRWKMKKSSDEIWIVKPPGASCGNGIKLVTKVLYY